MAEQQQLKQQIAQLQNQFANSRRMMNWHRVEANVKMELERLRRNADKQRLLLEHRHNPMRLFEPIKDVNVTVNKVQREHKREERPGRTTAANDEHYGKRRLAAAEQPDKFRNFNASWHLATVSPRHHRFNASRRANADDSGYYECGEEEMAAAQAGAVADESSGYCSLLENIGEDEAEIDGSDDSDAAAQRAK